MLPDSITTLGGSVFAGSGLTKINIPAGITSINDCFSGMNNLQEIVIPSHITTIGSYAFRGCSGLVSVTIPASVTKIGQRVFEGCTAMEYLTIAHIPVDASMGNNLASWFTFYNGYTYSVPASMKKITVTDDTVVVDKAFYQMDHLTSVEYLQRVTSIGNDAFYGCVNLSDLKLPGMKIKGTESLTSRGEGWELELPDSVVSIGKNAFTRCSKLTGLKTGPVLSSVGSAFQNCTGLKRVVAGSALRTIDENAFSGCTSLTDVDLGHSVKVIGSGAFYGCTALTSITIPGSVKTIERLFINCNSLQSIVLESGVTTISDYAFQMGTGSSTGTYTVTIPSTVTSIGKYVFYPAPTAVYAPAGSKAESYVKTNYPKVPLNPVGFYVTFDANSGTMTGSTMVQVKKGGKITRPEDPVRESYAFTGWYREAECVSRWNFAEDTMPGQNMTLYAGWRFEPGGFAYTERNAEATITGCSGTERDLVIPDTIGNGLTVTGLAARAIPAGVVSVSLPASVRDIDPMAFYVA